MISIRVRDAQLEQNTCKYFNTREAAEKAYEATKDNLILDNCPVEVTWSKPIDRHIHRSVEIINI